MATSANPKTNAQTPGQRPPIGKGGSAMSIEALQNESSKIFNDNRAEFIRITEGQFTAGKLNETEDAFRHAYSNAVVAQTMAKGHIPGAIALPSDVNNMMRTEMGIAATRAVGTAFEGISVMHHGRADHNHGDTGMDLHNNEVGYRVARAAGPNATREQLRDMVMDEMSKGNLILSNKDPRAIESFQNSYEMRGVQAVRDAGVYVGEKAIEAKNAVADAARGAYDKTSSALDSAARSFKDFASNAKEAVENTAKGMKDLHQNPVAKASDLGEKPQTNSSAQAQNATTKDLLSALNNSAPAAERTGGLGMPAPEKSANAQGQQQQAHPEAQTASANQANRQEKATTEQQQHREQNPDQGQKVKAQEARQQVEHSME